MTTQYKRNTLAAPRRSNSITDSHTRPARVAPPALQLHTDRNCDQNLIVGLLSGDSAAWQTLVTRYERLVFARVVRTLAQFGQANDHAAAEDITADIFAILIADDCAQLRRFEGRSKLSTWLDVVARRVTLRSISRTRLRQQNVVPDANLDTIAGAAGDDSATFGLDPTAVRAGMSQLGEADRAVLQLFYFERQSYSQIADQMGLSINTIGPKLKRAQQRLKKIISHQQGIPNPHE